MDIIKDLRSPKWMQTFTLFGIIMLQGLCVNAFFSTLLDFTEMLQASLSVVSFGLTIRSIGIAAGSFSAGFIFSYVDRMTFCAICLMCEGAFLAIVAHVKTIFLFNASKLAIGLTIGIVETGVFLTVADIWMEKTRQVILAIELIRFGAFTIAPLFVSPFVSRTHEGHPHQTHFKDNLVNLAPIVNSTNITSAEVPTNDNEYIPSNIWIPFSIIGALMNLSALVTLGVQLCKVKASQESYDVEPNKAGKDSSKKEGKSESYSIYTILVTMTCCTLLVIQCSAYNLFLQFWTTFVMLSDLGISKEKSLVMLSAFSFFMIIGILGAMALGKVCKPLQSLGLLVISLLAGHTILLFFSNTSEPMLWIGEFFIAFGNSSFFATLFATLQERVVLTNIIGSLAVLSCHVLIAAGIPVLMGHVIESQPMILVLLGLGSAMMMVICLICLNLLDRWRRNQKSNIQMDIPMKY